MNKSFRNSLIAGGIAALALGGLAHSAGFFTNGVPVAGGTQYPSTLPLTGNETIPADTNLPSGLNPASEAITTGQLAAFSSPQATPRNYLLNGDMQVAQQGTTAIVGGTTTITALQFSADRWFVDTNVGSGAGKSQVITATPSPPAGFTKSISVYRNSGALTQPVCMIQEIETQRATQLAGKSVVLSAYLQALAGMTATANNVTMGVITGTGTDQGIATLTASPAITPAWTGIATAGSTTVSTSTSWVRYNTTVIAIPTTATEVGVEVCFTPVGSASGTTDGFAMTGVQLEAVTGTGPAGPSPFEFIPFQNELRDAQRFFFQLNEPASGAATGITGIATTTSAQVLNLTLPVVMRGTTPVVAIPTTGTFAESIAATPTTWVSPTAGTCSTVACTITTGNTTTALSSIVVTGGGGSGVVYVKNDVVM
jgi:hypothetical protein